MSEHLLPQHPTLRRSYGVILYPIFGKELSFSEIPYLSLTELIKKGFNEEELKYYDNVIRNNNFNPKTELDLIYNSLSELCYVADKYIINRIDKIYRDYLWFRRKDFVMFLAGLGYLPNGDNKYSSSILGKRKQEPADVLFDVEDMTRYITKFL